MRESEDLNESIEMAASEQKLQESADYVQELLRQGWLRSEDDPNMVVNPADKELSVWRHPYSGGATTVAEAR